MIDLLRIKQGKGQPIRSDGPQSHLVTKKGTPTMGGLMILSGLLVSTLLWANPTSPYVWIVLGVTLSFGLIGFYDDYLKVTKQSHAGFAGRTRLLARSADRGDRRHGAFTSRQRDRSRPRWCFRSSRIWCSISAGSSCCSAPS